MLVRLFLSVLGFVLLRETHSAIKVATHDGREDPTLKEIGKEIRDAGKAVADAAAKKFRRLQRGPGHYGDAKKPMMDPIETMRAMMCWNRNRLIEHDDCMEWMVEACERETSGEGWCRKFRDYLKDKCRQGQRQACKYAEDMGMLPKYTDEHEDHGEIIVDKRRANDPVVEEFEFEDVVVPEKQQVPAGISPVGKQTSGGDSLSPAPSSAAAPMSTGLSMDENRGLPDQGYDEHSAGYVAHDNSITMTRDWHNEWPEAGEEDSSAEDICAEHPEHAWCKLQQSAEARRAYVMAHP